MSAGDRKTENRNKIVLVISYTGFYIYTGQSINKEKLQAILAWNKIVCKKAVDRHTFLPDLRNMQQKLELLRKS